jgi:hypothetical protein
VVCWYGFRYATFAFFTALAHAVRTGFCRAMVTQSAGSGKSRHLPATLGAFAPPERRAPAQATSLSRHPASSSYPPEPSRLPDLQRCNQAGAQGPRNATDTFIDLIAADSDQAYDWAVVNTTPAAGWSQTDFHRALMQSMSSYASCAYRRHCRKDAAESRHPAGRQIELDNAGNAVVNGQT